MNKKEVPQNDFPWLLCLWLILLMAGYIILHTLFSLLSLPNPPLLSFLPGGVYLLAGLLISRWGIKIWQRKPETRTIRIGAAALILMAILSILLGLLFWITGLDQI